MECDVKQMMQFVQNALKMVFVHMQSIVFVFP